METTSAQNGSQDAPEDDRRAQEAHESEQIIEAARQLETLSTQQDASQRMQQESERNRQAVERLGAQEFSANVATDKGVLSVTYVYDFNEIDIEQLLLAKSVFEFANSQARKPARSLAEHEQAAQMDALAVGMSYLFLLKRPDGTLQPFDRKTNRKDAYAFIKRLKSYEWPRLRLCKENFFLKANVVDYALLMQSLPLVETFAGQLTQAKNVNEPSESNLSGTQDSMQQESLTDS